MALITSTTARQSSQSYRLQPAIARTQKAAGLEWLAKQNGEWRSLIFRYQRAIRIDSPRDVDGVLGKFSRHVTLFVRPCPTKPRHGFVESVRIVHDDDAVAKVHALFAIALKADPQAELIVMNFVQASASFVYAVRSGVLALGAGHDGATQASTAFQLPLVPHIARLDAATQKVLRCPARSDLYLEGLLTEDSSEVCTLVQARPGPKIAGAAEFIPKKTKVVKILKPTADLLAWETLVAKHRKKPGVIAWAPNATLACHAAVHCVAAKIPFLTRASVKIGETIKAEKAVSKIQKAEFETGFLHAEVGRGGRPYPASHNALYGNEFEADLELAIAITHNAVRLSQTPYWGRLLGYAAGMIFRAGAMACIGEYRHIDSSHIPTGPGDRAANYKQTSHLSMAKLAERAARVTPGFLDAYWKGGGFGGLNWWRAALSVMKLYDLAVAGEYPKVLSQCNTIINVCHNNGKLLNKFTEQFGDIASKSAAYVFNNLDTVYSLLSKVQTSDTLEPRERLMPTLKYKILSVKVTSKSKKRYSVVLQIEGRKWRAITIDKKKSTPFQQMVEEL